MSRPRTAYTGCSLPFYSDTDEAYPYCGTAGPADARAALGRERVTRLACGLPHYGESCPYCATAEANAGAHGARDTAEGEPTTEPGVEPTGESATRPDSADATGTASGDATAVDTETPPPDQRRCGRQQSSDGGVVGRLLGVVRSLSGQ
jgi:hypothetical protein